MTLNSSILFFPSIVNGKVTDIRDVVPNASVYEFIDQDSKKKRSAPPPDYINYASRRTASKIERQQNDVERKRIEAIGKTMLEKTLSKIGLLDAHDWPDVEYTLFAKLEASSLGQIYLNVARSPERIIQRVEDVIKEQKFTKESLNLTTIRVRGPNKPDVSRDITKLVSDAGGDNLRFSMPETITDPNDPYELRILIHDLEPEALEVIKESLFSDDRFTEVTIV